MVWYRGRLRGGRWNAGAWLLIMVTVGCGEDAPSTGGNGCRQGLMPGDLVISEIMADPDGAEESSPWVELFNASEGVVDLSEVSLLFGGGEELTDERALGARRMEPREYLVAGYSDPEDQPEFVNIVLGEAPAMDATGGGRFDLECGARVLDEVQYAKVRDGVSRQFDGRSAPDAILNDDSGRWCDAETEFVEGSSGTPGGANESCPLPPSIDPEGCAQGDDCPDESGGELCAAAGGTRPAVVPRVGDLVVTEIMADPNSVTDPNGEWFEVYAARAVDLNGLSIGSGGDEIRMTLGATDCLRMEAASYWIFARSNDPSVNGGLPDVHALFNFGLNNSGGEIVLRYGDAEIDRVVYPKPVSGTSYQLGVADPKSTDNDVTANWCEAVARYGGEYGGSDAGTPGGKNPICAGSTRGECLDSGKSRPVVAPSPGDLVISEIMADPNAVSDANGEWFEVYVAKDMDLNGLQVGPASDAVKMTLGGEDCLHFAAGIHVVFGRSQDPQVNGGLPKVDLLFNFGLTNSGGGLYLGKGDAEIDGVAYGASKAGQALSLDLGAISAEENDDGANWCHASSAVAGSSGGGDWGSPGQPNPTCATSTADQCLDDGTLRPVEPPVAGDVILTEFMANPSAVSDATGEWIELYIARAVDLNGLELGTEVGAPKMILTSEACLRATAGEYRVIARSNDPSVNGGLSTVHGFFGFSLVNSGGSIVVGRGGEVLDQVAYAVTTSGKSTGLNPAHLSSDDNDDPALWCNGESQYGAGDFGSPGAANPACPDNSVNQCLDGGVSRALSPPQSGDLVITEFMSNPAAVADSKGEWFEVHAVRAVDLNGIELGTEDGVVRQTLSSSNCLRFGDGSRIVFARSDDPAANGGIPRVDFVISFGLVNSGGKIVLSLDGEPLDRIAYSSTLSGVATGLSPAAMTVDENDDSGNWCPAVDAFGAGDLGTPGEANPTCP